MTFNEFLATKGYSGNWCVATRASNRTAKYDGVITPKNYKQLGIEYERLTGEEAIREAKLYEQRFGVSLLEQLMKFTR